MNKNKKHSLLQTKSSRGLTLIELLVVLVILVAVGGLLVPTISNALARSHVATCATNFPEVHQMVQRALFESTSLGTDFESGIDIGDTSVGVNEQAVLTLTADDVAALADVGITTVVDHDEGATDYSVTFNIGAAQRTLATGQTLITLTPAQAESIYLPNGAGDRYVWLGIGPDWSLLGTLAPEPPVHFGDTPGFLPDEVHSRFGIILQLAEDDGAGTAVPFESAEFKRVSYSLGNTDGVAGAEFETGDNHIGVYWTELNES
ncbi:MAG: prepilin-type N-terminal cleavage/methylation domain-containing protein [Verrucomicrobiota bacterium]